MNSVKDMSPKGFVIGMEFHNVPKFDCIIFWYRAVDLLTWSLKMAIIFYPENRSFCYDQTPSGTLSMNGFPPCGYYPAVSLQYRQLEMVTTHKNSPAHFLLSPSKTLFCLPSHDGQVLWDDLWFVMGGRVQSNCLCVE